MLSVRSEVVTDSSIPCPRCTVNYHYAGPEAWRGVADGFFVYPVPESAGTAIDESSVRIRIVLEESTHLL